MSVCLAPGKAYVLSRARFRSRPENLTRPYTIQTTFPVKVLEDDAKTIQEAGLANSVVVQRWA